MARCLDLVAARGRSYYHHYHIKLLYTIINNVHSHLKEKPKQTKIILYYTKR